MKTSEDIFCCLMKLKVLGHIDIWKKKTSCEVEGWQPHAVLLFRCRRDWRSSLSRRRYVEMLK